MMDNLRYTLLLLAACVFVAASTAQQPPYKILKQRFENGKVLHAQFKYQYKDSFTNQTSTNRGTLWISSQKYKIVSSPQTILVDGKTSTVYDENRNRVIISKYVEEEDDFAPSRILNGIDSTYTVINQKEIETGYRIKLKSKDPFSLYKNITITLNQQYVPVKIKAVDQANNVITTTFSNASYLPNKSVHFTITYPDDANIVDLRK